MTILDKKIKKISKVIYSLEVFIFLQNSLIGRYRMNCGRIRENRHPRIFTTLSIECWIKICFIKIL